MSDETPRIRRGLGEKPPAAPATPHAATPAAEAEPTSSPAAPAAGRARRGLGESAAPAASSAPAPAGRRGLGESTPPAASEGSAPPASSSGGRRGLGEPASAPASQPAASEAPRSSGGRSALGASSAAPAAPTASEAAEKTERGPLRRWLLLAGGLVVLAALVILGARLLVGLPAVQDFLTTYPGEYHLPEDAPVGFPAWLSWAHFLNAFFLVLMIKTGWQVRTQRKPPASWVRDNTRWPRTKNPPRKISLTLWLHLALDSLWFLNGVIFVVLLIVTGHWVRVVPTSWEVIPNAVSAALQYASLNWPVENGWVNYNSLQQLAYFVTIFVAAPLAAATGIRMSGAWSSNWKRLSAAYPVEVARAIHFPVMLYFVLFLIAHVTLVLSTGALRNLNHMYGGQDAVNWTGAIIFLVSLVVMAGAWVAARPIVIAPIAGLFGKVGR